MYCFQESRGATEVFLKLEELQETNVSGPNLLSQIALLITMCSRTLCEFYIN